MVEDAIALLADKPRPPPPPAPAAKKRRRRAAAAAKKKKEGCVGHAAYVAGDLTQACEPAASSTRTDGCSVYRRTIIISPALPKRAVCYASGRVPVPKQPFSYAWRGAGQWHMPAHPMDVYPGTPPYPAAAYPPSVIGGGGVDYPVSGYGSLAMGGNGAIIASSLARLVD